MGGGQIKTGSVCRSGRFCDRRWRIFWLRVAAAFRLIDRTRLCWPVTRLGYGLLVVVPLLAMGVDAVVALLGGKLYDKKDMGILLAIPVLSLPISFRGVRQESKREGKRMPKIASQAKRLRIYIGETDHWKQHSLYHAIVTKAKELDMAGATVFRGVMGYGANSRIHTASIVDLSSDLPVLVEIIDSEEYINKLLPLLDDMLEEGMVTIDDIEVIKYGKKPPKR